MIRLSTSSRLQAAPGLPALVAAEEMRRRHPDLSAARSAAWIAPKTRKGKTAGGLQVHEIHQWRRYDEQRADLTFLLQPRGLSLPCA